MTLLQRGGSSADPERLAGWIEGVARQAGALERGLDEMSQIEQLDDHLSEATVAEVARRVVGLLGPLAGTRRVELRFQDGSGGESTTAPGLARRLLKLGARCLALAPAGVECIVSCTSSDAESASEPRAVDGVRLEISSESNTFSAGRQIEALRQGIHSGSWTVECEDRGVVLRIPR